MANQSARLILRTRFGAIIFFAASVIVFYFVHLGSCATWISSSLGFLPMHIVMTAIIMVMLYWFMPTDPDAQDQVLQVRWRSAHSCICQHVPGYPGVDSKARKARIRSKAFVSVSCHHVSSLHTW